MLPLSDGLRARRFPIVNVAIIVANFAVWLFYELPHLRHAVFEASFYPCTVDNSCQGSVGVPDKMDLRRVAVEVAPLHSWRNRHRSHAEGGRTMSMSPDSFDKLSAKIEDAKRSIRAAASESEAELKAKVDEARKNADDRAAELSAKTQATAGQAETHWQQIQSDWDKHRQTIRQRIDQMKADQDLEAAEFRAESAEADARDAVDFAGNAIDEATYAMLDAILARKDVSVLLEASS